MATHGRVVQNAPKSLNSRGRKLRLHAALTGGAIISCGDIRYIAGVEDRRSFDPPAIYRDWWAATETCSGQTAPIERVSWFLASGITGDGLVARARWAEAHQITIVAGYENDPKVVRHEMLHDLLNGDRSHSRDQWRRCDLLFENNGLASS